VKRPETLMNLEELHQRFDGFPTDASRAEMMSLAYTKVNWEGVKHRDQVSSVLMGNVDYWNSGEFSSPLQAELSILRGVDQYKWHTEQPFGKPMWEHLCCLMKLLNPQKTDILTGLYDSAQAFCILLGTGGKVLNQLGARSMSKTGGNVRLMRALMTIKPEKTMLFISCPTEKVSDTGAWGDFRAISNDAHKNNPHLFPDYKDYKDRLVRFINSDDKFGVAMARTTAEAGNYQGTKGHEDGDGFIIVFNEEINKHPRSAYMEIEENVTSNRQFMFFNAWNWKKDTDMGAVVSEPDAERCQLKQHSDIDIDNDQVYDCVGEGLTVRYDGLYSINMLAGQRLTPYTFFNYQDDFMPLLKRYGKEHPTFKSQARAYPGASGEHETVLSQTTVLKSRYKDVFTVKKVIGRTAFLDPAFGGKDSPEFSWAETQEIWYHDGGDAKDRKVATVLVWKDYIRALKLVAEARWNDFWIERATNAGLIMTHVKPNEPINYSEQLVVQVAEKCKQYDIPWRNYGFDFSMDDTIMTAHDKLMGFDHSPYKYNVTKLDGIELPHLNTNSKDLCYNKRDELFFQAAGMFENQMIRNGMFIDPAIDDLCRTRYDVRGSKRKIEDKAEFKKRNRGRSPDKLDAMVGNIDMARRRTGLKQLKMSVKSVKPQSFFSGAVSEFNKVRKGLRF